ncbi:MAG: type II toxin-antitoxin system VapC family toxin [Candidatus Sumerlaeia bacterium]|nr:type II toxin-antitoxin system VapC family toxin [Candidatus Sumerlaeia bacterium]
MPYEKLILDTNIVSYLMKGDVLGRLYAPHLSGKLLSISFITVGELYYGAEKASWGEKRRLDLETTLRNFVVLPYDYEIARCYGQVFAQREKSGRRIQPNDAWIAACALRHGVQLVTHNAKDFEGIRNLQLISEISKIP